MGEMAKKLGGGAVCGALASPGTAERVAVAALLALSFLTRFHMIGHPGQAVFDEVYFVEYVRGYATGVFNFDIHPPLGKLVLYWWAQLAGTSDKLAEIRSIGLCADYSNGAFASLRWVVSLFGSLLPLLLYVFARLLFRSGKTAVFAALFAVLDNGLLVESRFVLLDVFYLFFGLLGLVFCLLCRRAGGGWAREAACVTLCSVFVSAAFSVKWTGLVFAGVAVGVFVFDLARGRGWGRFAARVAVLSACMAAVYAGSFAAQFSLQTRYGRDARIMSPGFQKTLSGSPYAQNRAVLPASFASRFLELNGAMFLVNSRNQQPHLYGSKWYSWPPMLRPVIYWIRQIGPEEGCWIYFQGNPAVWWPGLLAMVFWAAWLVRQCVGKRAPALFWPVALVVSSYSMNLLPYALVQRVSFLYHYLPSLLFLYVGLAAFVASYAPRFRLLTALLVAAAAGTFLFFAPVSYGTPLGFRQFLLRVWLPGWM